jgi:hypothetical protein
MGILPIRRFCFFIISPSDYIIAPAWARVRRLRGSSDRLSHPDGRAEALPLHYGPSCRLLTLGRYLLRVRADRQK